MTGEKVPTEVGNLIPPMTRVSYENCAGLSYLKPMGKPIQFSCFSVCRPSVHGSFFCQVIPVAGLIPGIVYGNFPGQGGSIKDTH